MGAFNVTEAFVSNLLPRGAPENEAMQETELVGQSESFRQGDIIKLDRDTKGRNDPNYGVIINADCDLAHGKLDGNISYLAMYEFREFLQKFWAPDFVAEHLKQNSKQLSDLCELKNSNLLDLIDWIKDESVQQVSDKLSAECKIKEKYLEKLNSYLRKIQICTDTSKEPFQIFSTICDWEKNPENYARKHITAAQRQPGEGHFFINEIVGHEGIGYIIRMRRIYSIEEKMCFESTTKKLVKTNKNSDSAIRIARLAAPFRYKIAQLFAHQYSRIGLPDEVRDLHSLAIDDVVENISKGLS